MEGKADKKNWEVSIRRCFLGFFPVQIGVARAILVIRVVVKSLASRVDYRSQARNWVA